MSAWLIVGVVGFFLGALVARRRVRLAQDYFTVTEGEYVHEMPTVGSRWDGPRLSHLNGIRWSDATPPPLRHHCWSQTRGWMGFNSINRCACGAINMNRSGWMERNSRRDVDA